MPVPHDGHVARDGNRGVASMKVHLTPAAIILVAIGSIVAAGRSTHLETPVIVAGAGPVAAGSAASDAPAPTIPAAASSRTCARTGRAVTLRCRARGERPVRGARVVAARGWAANYDEIARIVASSPSILPAQMPWP